MPRVSVVLPTHNRATLLARSIGSVLSQTFADLELAVVDDASTDDIAAVVASFGDRRVRHLRLEPRSGVSRARNRGVELAQGDWVAFQDSDDVWLPGKLERQIAAIRPGTVLVATRDRVTNDAAMSYVPPPDTTAAVSVLTRHVPRRMPPAATWLGRREALIAVGGFDPELDCYEDWELALRLAARGEVLLVNDVLVLRQRTPGSLFSDEQSRLRNLRKVVERHRPSIARDPGTWSYYCNALGQMLARSGDRREAWQWFREALRARPGDPRTWLNLAMSCLGRLAFAVYVDVARSARRVAATALRRLFR